MKVVTGFICKLINESVLNYSSEASLEVLLCLFYTKVYRVNFNDFYKGFYTSKDDIFVILLLIINVVIEPVFAFIIWIKVFNVRSWPLLCWCGIIFLLLLLKHLL